MLWYHGLNAFFILRNYLNKVIIQDSRFALLESFLAKAANSERVAEPDPEPEADSPVFTSVFHPAVGLTV
jgi:hypothetical protein